MNETNMLTEILDIFWREKLRFVQFCLDELSQIDRTRLDQTNNQGKTFRWAIQQMIAHDRNFSFYLPFSLRLSSFFFFSSYKEQEIEKDLENIRDRYTPPAFPSHFWEIKVQNARELRIKSSDPDVRALCETWLEVLVRLEAKLAQISEREAYRKRYTSLTGIHTISGAINNNTEYNHLLWNLHLSGQL